MITEITDGIFRVIKQIVQMGSLMRTIIYTIGHILIAMTSNTMITGADWSLAAADALIEPCINGVWYFLLDYLWSSRQPSQPYVG